MASVGVEKGLRLVAWQLEGVRRRGRAVATSDGPVGLAVLEERQQVQQVPAPVGTHGWALLEVEHALGVGLRA